MYIDKNRAVVTKPTVVGVCFLLCLASARVNDPLSWHP